MEWSLGDPIILKPDLGQLSMSKTFNAAISASLKLAANELVLRGSGCGSVGRVVASDTRGPRFESSHWQNLLNICLPSTVLKRRK